MNEIHINNDTCNEIGKIKNIYWIWHSNFIKAELVKRTAQWRINKLNLQSGITPQYFDVEVNDWQWLEEGKRTSRGTIFNPSLSGNIPKMNEWAESYFNEMSRRPMVIFIEDFNGNVWLFGGKNPKTRFSFSKAINGRNGYDLVFENLSIESSLIMADEDFFPIPLPPDKPVKQGIIYQIPTALKTYTSYDTSAQDMGGRVQSGWYNHTPPAYPESVAQLDYSLSNYFFRLKENNKFGNKFRFTDVDGNQTFPNTANKNCVFIDHLTGYMWIRRIGAGIITASTFNWQGCLDAVSAYSIAVDGNMYDDWWNPSSKELFTLRGSGENMGNAMVDGSNTIQAALGNGNIYTNETLPGFPTYAYYVELNGQLLYLLKTGLVNNIMACRKHLW